MLASEQEQPPGSQGMGELLDQTGVLRTLQRGETVEGVVMRVDQDAVLVSIGGKSEGMVPLEEMRTLSPKALKSIVAGSRVFATVLRTEGEGGFALLSIDRAREELGWLTLERFHQSGEILEARAVEKNRGGLVVAVEGVRAFVPLSQLAQQHRSPGQGEDGGPRLDSPGEPLKLKVLEVDRRHNRAILSEKAAWQEWRQQQKERLLQELREGQVRKGKVTGIRDFGAFVDLGGADGLIHVSELSWGSVQSVAQVLKIGEEVEVYVLKVDTEAGRISLSLRRLQPEPWETVSQRYQVGQVVIGTVTRLTNFGAFIRLEGSVEGLVHLSEIGSRPVRHPSDVLREGEVVSVKILRIEPERRRIGLSIRQAAEEA